MVMQIEVPPDAIPGYPMVVALPPSDIPGVVEGQLVEVRVPSTASPGSIIEVCFACSPARPLTREVLFPRSAHCWMDGIRKGRVMTARRSVESGVLQAAYLRGEQRK